jgi:hypothetical protein
MNGVGHHPVDHPWQRKHSYAKNHYQSRNRRQRLLLHAGERLNEAYQQAYQASAEQ